MRSKFLFILLVLLHQQVFSQNRAMNWAFGDSAGLNFETEPPTPFLSSIQTLEPSATISDKEGNLLFYTNGKTIWNAEHEGLLNGNFLDIGVGTLSSTTQGVIIIPDPGDTLKYYIFHMDFNYIKYTIVDLNFEDGLGLVTSKNIILFDIPGMTEKMHAVRHGNGRDWWLVIEAYPEIGPGTFGYPLLFYQFLISPTGLDSPIINEGILYEDSGGPTAYLGQIKFNHMGNMLGCTNGRSVVLYNFDRCSGYIYHHYTIDSIFIGNNSDEVYGIEFSPDDSKIYITKNGFVGNGILYQYTLNSTEEISDTKQIIYNANDTGIEKKYLGQLQLALNGKIYLTIVGPTYPTTLSVINNPNEFGVDCNFDTLTIYTGEKIVNYSLPNMPNFNLGALPKSACDTISTSIENISESTFAIYPNPAQNNIYIKSSTSGPAPFILMDVFGKEVMHTEVQFNYPINISHLPQGIYIAMLKQHGNCLTEKLIVTRN